MGKIILDKYLINQGVTKEHCQAALHLADKDLAEHTLTFKVLKERKKKGLFWRLRLFLDNYSEELSIGIESYKESDFKETISILKAPGNTKRRGNWPKKKQVLRWIAGKQKALTRAKKREEKQKAKEKKEEQRKQNLLPRALYSITQTQKNLQEIQQALQKAYDVLHQEILVYQDTQEGLKLEKLFSAAMAYSKANLTERAVVATEENKQILLWDSEQNLILKMNRSGDTMEYQGIVFTFKQIHGACGRVQGLKAKMDREKAEQRLATFLAQIPKHLDAQIQALQQQAEHYWDRMLFLNEIDFKFLQGYKRASFKFHKLESNIQTQEQMNDWITAWLMRAKKVLATPSPADASTQTILGLVACSPKYGIQTYAMWLGNSNAKTLQDKKLDNVFRAALKNNTIVAIAAKIETIINYQWLKVTKVGTHNLPVLVITDKGKTVLQLLERRQAGVASPPILEPRQEPANTAPSFVVPAPIAVDVHSHFYWLKEMQQKGHLAYVEFLNTPQSIANIADWAEEEVAEIQRMLNECLKGWQVLAQWKISKHPIKYKALQRLL
jgi:hypothetical protein